jgi:hypothetical protein
VSNVAAITQAPSVRFAVVARSVAEEARRLGLRAPAFKSPPRVEGADRTVRRGGRDVVVAVRVRGRPFAAVVADLVEGVVVANQLTGIEASKARSMLWEALDITETLAA